MRVGQLQNRNFGREAGFRSGFARTRSLTARIARIDRLHASCDIACRTQRRSNLRRTREQLTRSQARRRTAAHTIAVFGRWAPSNRKVLAGVTVPAARKFWQPSLGLGQRWSGQLLAVQLATQVPSTAPWHTGQSVLQTQTLTPLIQRHASWLRSQKVVAHWLMSVNESQLVGAGGGTGVGGACARTAQTSASNTSSAEIIFSAEQ